MLLFSPIIKVREVWLGVEDFQPLHKIGIANFYEITHPSLSAISSNPYKDTTHSK
jgi:hypothetical protein